MKAKTFFMSITAISCAVLSVFVSIANPPLPDYYINDSGACVLAPTTTCTPGAATCKRVILGQSAAKQIYNNRGMTGGCQDALQEPALKSN